MWILESDGEFLQGKRIWLRPGKRYLFGRVKKDGVAHAIEHKTISRKHFVIEIDPVKPGQGSQVHVRSKVTITDEKTKGGTFIDGVELRDGSRQLKGAEHAIRPGKYPHDLRIKWHQMCLSFSFSSKELKADPLPSRRERLEDLDIKTIIEYVVDETTHVVTTKRNTAKGLQALINGKYIVNNSYIDALVYAGTSEDLGEPENLCPLERDFDAAWPEPLSHLPPPGKERIEAPASASDDSFGPNTQRQNLFEGFTFIICSKGQYENLLPMVTAGHGKALLFPVVNGKTSADELEQFLRTAAGQKKLGGTESPLDTGGVVLVRWTAKDEIQQWADDLADEVSLRIDQRPVEQSEFLNIVLNNTTAILRRSCGLASTAASMATPIESAERGIEHPQSTQALPPLRPSRISSVQPSSPTEEHNEESNAAGQSSRIRSTPPTQEQPPPKRQRRIGTMKSRFKAFDDGLDVDMESIPAYEPTPSNPEESVEPSLGPADDRSFRPSVTPAQHGEAFISEDDDDMEDLLPAAAKMRRQKLEMERQGKKSKKASQAEPAPPTKKIKKEKEIDYIGAARKRREEEEEALRKDQEALEHADIDVENAQNLAVVVEMELPVRNGKGSTTTGQASDRWDESWNGRKNFKRFRRKGEGDGRPRRLQNVIVSLEEAKPTSYGIGDKYWHGSNQTSRKDTQRSQKSSTQTQSQTKTDTIPDPVAESTPATSRLQKEAEDIVGDIDIDEPRSTRATQHTTTAAQSQASLTKRSATSQIGTAPKRQRTLRNRADDSDDELKFRFGRRKK